MQKQGDRRGRAGGSTLAERIANDPSVLVAVTFVMLQIFKLLALLITDKTVENILIVPFQIAVFIVPAILYARLTSGKGFGAQIKGLRLRVPRLRQIPLILSALFLLIFGNVLVSLVFAGTGQLEEGFTLYNTFVSRNSGGFFSTVYLIFAYAVIPAFCEELVFRAILCREYEKYNVLCGIAVSSVFFAMLHFDLARFPVYVFSGLLLGLTMYATGSVIASMIVHMIFNVFGLFGQPYLAAFYTITGGTGGLFVFILCMLTLLATALFCQSASRCYAARAEKSNIPNRKLLPPSDKLTFVISGMIITPASVAAFAIYIIVIVAGFFL